MDAHTLLGSETLARFERARRHIRPVLTWEELWAAAHDLARLHREKELSAGFAAF